MQPWIGDEERRAVEAYLASGGWLTEFEQTREFERLIAAQTGARHASVLCNGTMSLYAALWAAGIGPGDEVLVPDYTMIATANTVLLVGARPVLVDVRAEDLCLDPDLAEAAIGPRTRAILHVSLNGREGSIDRIAALAAKHGLVLLEDAAQSFGSLHRGRALGTFGAIGSYSFSAPKIITTGQGGALVTDDDRLAERVRQIRDFGRPAPGVDRHLTLGFNFKFTDLQAVIGIAQMRSLADRLARKRAMFALYQSELASVDDVRFLATNLADCAPWFIDVLVPNPDALAAHLRERGIGSRRFYPAVHTQAPYEETEPRPQAEAASARGLWLPSSAFLDASTIRRICGEVRRFYGRER